MENETKKGPTLARMFVVAMGVGEWSPAEIAWLENHPQHHEFAKDLAASARKFKITGLFSPEEVLALKDSPGWAQHEDRLDEMVELPKKKRSGFQRREDEKRRSDDTREID